MNNKEICILGGTGFVGSHLASRLTELGYVIKILTRRRERHRALLVLPTTRVIETTVQDVAQLNSHFAGCGAVINLIGILNEKGHDGRGFHEVHVELVEKILQVCKSTGVSRLLHMSALNADPSAGSSHYLRTKGEAEQHLLSASDDEVNVTCFRPSVIFGPGDSFLSRFAGFLGITPIMFPLACPHARFAPVYVGDVVDAFTKALQDKSTYGKSYDLCGPHDYSLKDLVKYAGEVSGHRRWIIGLPDWLSKLQAAVMEYIPGKPFSLDNYRSATQDSACPNVERCPTSVESVAPAYLGRRNIHNILQEFRETRSLSDVVDRSEGKTV
jgi:uncharacterized protein YbjT (DUF2867 family)